MSDIKKVFYNYIKYNCDKEKFDKLVAYKNNIKNGPEVGAFLGDYTDYDEFMKFQWKCLGNYDDEKLSIIWHYMCLGMDKHINWSGNGGEYIDEPMIIGFIFDYRGELFACS